MSLIKSVLVSLFCLFMLVSCSPDENKEAKESAPAAKDVDAEVAKKYAEMMAEHDMAMVKMDAIYSLKQELKKEKEVIDSTYYQRNKKQVLQKHENIDLLIAKLDSADRAMMAWMRNIPAVDEMEKGTALETLEEEHASIHQIDSAMNEAIADAKAFIATKK